MLTPPVAFTGECIVCFAGEDWWYHNPHSNLHLMKEFAKSNRVLFVNSIGVRAPDFRADPFIWKRVIAKLKSLLKYFRKAEPNLYVLTPVALPMFRRWQDAIRRINTALLLLQIRIIGRGLRFKKPILWVCVPSTRDVALRLRKRWAKCLVYYCVDNISHLAGADHTAVAEMEQDLQRHADVALFVNHRLAEQGKRMNPRTYHLTHGVDFEHFAQGSSGGLAMPAELLRIRRPIAGYIGRIQGLDLDLIERVSAGNPDVSFVFIGERYQDVSAVERLPNIYFLGKKTYEDLPKYLQAFDCCCICYVTGDQFNDYRNPKKLLEYLATGLPIVSVPLVELERFRDYVYVAKDAEEFTTQLRTALQADPPDRRQQRVAYASNHTWTAVAAKAAEHIAAHSPEAQ